MPGIRERVRAELVAEIVEVARRHLGERGAAGLSVRAVTRELGMAPSAVYRYFPNRDALLTALIVSAYEGLGAAAREAEAGVDREDHLGRWHAVFRAVRAWSLTPRPEGALTYAPPAPRHLPPEGTVGPAAGVARRPAAGVPLVPTRCSASSTRGPPCSAPSASSSSGTTPGSSRRARPTSSTSHAPPPGPSASRAPDPRARSTCGTAVARSH